MREKDHSLLVNPYLYNLLYSTNSFIIALIARALALKEMKRSLASSRDTPDGDGGSGPQNRAEEIRRQRQEVRAQMSTILNRSLILVERTILDAQSACLFACRKCAHCSARTALRSAHLPPLPLRPTRGYRLARLTSRRSPRRAMPTRASPPHSSSYH